MDELICPEYNFELFCYRVLAKNPQNPLEAIDLATHESWLARKLHKARTKESDFRSRSKGRLYCENIRRLVAVLANGQIPAGSTPEFVAALKPLALKLLERWEIGDLRKALTDY